MEKKSYPNGFTRSKVVMLDKINYDKFMKVAETFNFGILMKLALMYGPTQLEFNNLGWPAFDFDKELIQISGGKMKPRTLPFLPGVRELLFKLKRQIAKNKARYPTRYKDEDSDMLCLDQFGKHIPLKRLGVWLSMICEQADIPEMRFFHLRQNCFFWLLKNGASRSEACAFLGLVDFNGINPKTKKPREPKVYESKYFRVSWRKLAPDYVLVEANSRSDACRWCSVNLVNAPSNKDKGHKSYQVEAITEEEYSDAPGEKYSTEFKRMKRTA